MAVFRLMAENRQHTGFLLLPLPRPRLTYWDTSFRNTNNRRQTNLIARLSQSLESQFVQSPNPTPQVARAKKGCYRILSNLKPVQIHTDEGFNKCRGKEGVA